MPKGPPNAATLDRLIKEGFERNECLSALLRSNGDEAAALQFLRASSTQTTFVQATVVQATVGGGGSGKSLTDQLHELDAAKNAGLISQAEYDVSDTRHTLSLVCPHRTPPPPPTYARIFSGCTERGAQTKQHTTSLEHTTSRRRPAPGSSASETEAEAEAEVVIISKPSSTNRRPPPAGQTRRALP